VVAETGSELGQLRDLGAQAHQPQGRRRAIEIAGDFGAHGRLNPTHL
jgi:hypothetical protein